MRPSRTALSLIAAAAASGAAVIALASGSSATVAAPAPKASVSAPVATAPKVVAHAVVAPKKAAPVAKAKPAAVKPVVAKPVVKPVVKKTVVAAPKPVAAAPKPAAPKPATTTTVASSSTGNDYPFKTATTNDPDTWGFTKRQCVSFAAWRLARAGRAINNSQGWGSAHHWDDTARALGVRVSSTPRVGAIAQWNVGESSKVWIGGGQGGFSAGSYGHVGYVAAVYSDGSALIEQYNAMGDRSYSTMRMTAPRYLF